MTESHSTESELLEAASRVLERVWFSSQLRPFGPPGRDWLLAEDDLFAIGILAGESVADLRSVEARASELLLARLGGREGGPKRWDIYLVFLTPQRWTALDDRERMEFEYDVRGIRRLIAAQVVPDEQGSLEDSVEGALRPFLPLAEPLSRGLPDVDEALAAALVLNGIEEKAAPIYVQTFRARGNLDGV